MPLAITIAAVIILADIGLLSILTPRGRHSPRRIAARAREDQAAAALIEAWRPDRSLAGLRLRRDLRRWIRTSGVRKLP